MTKFYLMIETYFYRIHDKSVQDELVKFNIATKNTNGELLDSLLILKEILKLLKELQRRDEMVIFYYIVELIVGIRYTNMFIVAFLGDV